MEQRRISSSGLREVSRWRSSGFATVSLDRGLFSGHSPWTLPQLSTVRIVSLTDLDKMAATIGVMLASSAFGAVKSAVSDEVKRQVSSTLMKQPQVQKMRKSIDGVRDRLMNRVRRGRKAVSATASSVGEERVGHASVAGERDVGRLEDLIDFEDEWEEIRQDNEVLRINAELDAGVPVEEQGVGVVRARTVALQLSDEVRWTLDQMVARSREAVSSRRVAEEGSMSRASSPEESSDGERRAQFGGVEQVRVPRRMSTQEASWVAENARLQEKLIQAEKKIEMIKEQNKKSLKLEEARARREREEVERVAMEWQFWARCYGFDGVELLTYDAARVWARQQLRASAK